MIVSVPNDAVTPVNRYNDFILPSKVPIGCDYITVLLSSAKDPDNLWIQKSENKTLDVLMREMEFYDKAGEEWRVPNQWIKIGFPVAARFPRLYY